VVFVFSSVIEAAENGVVGRRRMRRRFLRRKDGTVVSWVFHRVSYGSCLTESNSAVRRSELDNVEGE
jgi:hypothetical protein